MNEKLSDCANIELLKEIVTYLYDLLDDIDTITDIAKEDDKLYRSLVEKIQQNKSYYLSSDGYSLFLEKSTSERPKTFYDVVNEQLAVKTDN